MRVYEVDLPAISALKRRKTARILGRLPAHVDYVEADFLHDELPERLTSRGYRLPDATLLILSGVAPYLPGPAVERLMLFAGSHTSPRTSIVFDYVYREMVEGYDAFRGAARTRRRLQAIGEPLKFGIPLGATSQFVGRFGMTLASDLHPNDLVRAYLSRVDGTALGQPYGFAAIAHARRAAA